MKDFPRSFCSQANDIAGGLSTTSPAFERSGLGFRGRARRSLPARYASGAWAGQDQTRLISLFLSFNGQAWKAEHGELQAFGDPVGSLHEVVDGLGGCCSVLQRLAE